MRLGCAEVSKIIGYEGPCCDSCHDDGELGYDMLDVEVDGREAEVCCHVLHAANEWAAAVEARMAAEKKEG